MDARVSCLKVSLAHPLQCTPYWLGPDPLLRHADEMLFNVEPEMRQLSVISRAPVEQPAAEGGGAGHHTDVAHDHMAGAVLAMETGASD